jgi:hypothetical protein
MRTVLTNILAIAYSGWGSAQEKWLPSVKMKFFNPFLFSHTISSISAPRKLKKFRIVSIISSFILRSW